MVTSKAGLAITLPPGTSRLPVIDHRWVMAWAMVVPEGPMSIGTPHWMAAGLAVAYMRAAATMSSAGTQVISETRSKRVFGRPGLQFVKAGAPRTRRTLGRRGPRR